MRPWLGAKSTLYVCMPAQDSAMPSPATHKRKHCLTHKTHRNRRAESKPSHISAVNEGRRTELNNSNKQADVDNSSQGVDQRGLKQSQPVGELQLLPNRRFFLAGLGSLTIVLVSNLGGATGFLLGLDGGRTASKLKIDSIFPVHGLKRCINYQQKFEFQYPGDWLADRNMYARRAQRIESRNSLDPMAPSRSRKSVAEPEAAFGPPGSSGEENISVVVAPIQTGFRLESLGTAEQAGRRFLETTVASINANREAVLVSAQSRYDDIGQLYYNLEYTVKSPDFFRHNISVYAARNGMLYTFNSQCPEDKWATEKTKLAVAAQSFSLLL
ncbi:Thylakoid-anchored PsbP-like protein [Trebouxia sp. C0010 RCD-2024]